MSSIWKKNREVTNDVKRNNFPLYKMSHSTFKFGYLYPVYCKQVYPTDSFRIRSAFDLKMMPIAFPVQSKIRANLHFFYVRNKNLWKGWQDFIEGLKSTDSHPHPYILPSDDKVTTGSIHDFLGVPTTVVSSNISSLSLPAMVDRTNIVFSPSLSQISDYSVQLLGGYAPATNINLNVNDTGDNRYILYRINSLVYNKFSIKKGSSFATSLKSFYNLGICFKSGDNTISTLGSVYSLLWQEDDDSYFFELPDEVFDAYKDFMSLYPDNTYLFFNGRYDRINSFEPFMPSGNTDLFGLRYNLSSASGYFQYSDLALHYYENEQPLNALPYRAYESIFYGYFANDVLQPLVIDGEKEYNKFIHNDGDGLDTTDYHLFRRNYELDFLTSALPSPQAGPAPLVGISALGEVTITDANGVSTGQAEVLPSGEITKIVATSPMASVEHARTMMNIAALGFNINDLRNANALQRMAEQTMRSGYRYINWVKGQYGRAPEYRELDMPEFIGGYSREIDMRTVVSQADTLVTTGEGTTGSALGDFAANGRVVGGQDHDITHYCDDYGWIIGIMSVTPTPAYSQLLPKHMLAPTSPLDYANPFMNQIGMQPITYREVTPLQAYMDSLVNPDHSVDDVFGYQRPNYDAVGEVDEVHGEFRASLKDMLINRQFDGRPELGTEFLEINPSEINDIFINQNPDDDVFIGHLAFKVDAKRPFPRVHIPSLGR